MMREGFGSSLNSNSMSPMSPINLDLATATIVLMQLDACEVFPVLNPNYDAIDIFSRAYKQNRAMILKRHIVVNENDMVGISNCKSYKIDGKLHRDGGLPACEFANGTKYWYVNGEHHQNRKLATAKPSGEENYGKSRHGIANVFP